MSTNTPLHLHLVSDATGDTVRSVARACLVQFEEIDTTEHFWVLVRSSAQMERVIEGIAKNPGIVLCTVVDEALRAALEHACRQLKVRYVPLLDPVISAIASHVGGRSRGLPGRQHSLDAAYFDRIEAMHYTMAHDDGQATSRDGERPDVVARAPARMGRGRHDRARRWRVARHAERVLGGGLAARHVGELDVLPGHERRV